MRLSNDSHSPHVCVCVSDFLWLNESVLVSCSKDGKLVQQLMAEADRPSEKAVSETDRLGQIDWECV